MIEAMTEVEASEEKEDKKEELSEVEKVNHNPKTEEKLKQLQHKIDYGYFDRVFQQFQTINILKKWQTVQQHQ